MSSHARGARTTNELIKQMPGDSVQFASTLKKLGLWSSRVHDSIDERRPFVRNIDSLSADQLANELAFWTSEAGRISELHGYLTAQKVKSDLELRVATAKARTQVRSQNANKTDANGKAIKLTTGEVNDLAESQQVLIDARESAVLVESTLAAVAASKEATLMYLNTLSREITRRGDLLRARM